MLAIPVQTALEESKALILQNILDSKKAHLLEIALRLESVKVHESGRQDDARELQLIADDLASRFTPVKIDHPALSPA